MSTIKITGASDDLVEVFGVKMALDVTDHGQDSNGYPMGPDGQAEYNIYGLAEFEVCDALLVVALFTRLGTWAFAPGLLEEGEEIPDWPIRVVKGSLADHSTQLEIDVPEDVLPRIKRVR